MAKEQAKPNEDLEDLNLDEETGTEDKVTEPTQAESQAMEDGWRPEDEWEGEADDWVGAKEFNFRGELMSRISSQSTQLADSNKKMEKLSSALQVLGEHHQKTAETEHKRILSALKKEKAIALEEGDSESVVEIDDRISDLKDSKKEEAAQLKEDKADVADAKQNVPPAVAKWMSDDKNAWYHSDPVRRGIANAVSDAYMQSNPEATPMDMLKHVDTVIRQEMPHKFKDETPAGKRQGSVTETSNSRRGAKKKFTSRDLSSEQLEVAKTFKEMGIFSDIQTYVDELVSNGDLG